MFKIGEKVWVASYGSVAVSKPCPVCYGDKYVTVILGNGDRVVAPCSCCRSAILEPTGVVTEYEYRAEGARPVTITEIKVVQENGDTQYQYNGRLVSGVDVFSTEEEARERSHELAVIRQEEELTRAEHLKANVVKSYIWNVGYHLREAKRCRESAERHEKLATLCERKDQSLRGGR